jgi:hypothetical protein
MKPVHNRARQLEARKGNESKEGQGKARQRREGQGRERKRKEWLGKARSF